jgi:CubicO group peptidase (beta-lactamase class C family)
MVQPVGVPRRLRRGRLSFRALTLLAAIIAAVPLTTQASAEDRFPGAAWEHATPTQSGWSDEKLAEAHALSDRLHLTSFMTVHHGLVVAEWGDTSKRTELASVRKSLLSALYGIAVAKHQISLDSTMASLAIDDSPPRLTETEKMATVRMLLQARSGIYHAALYETSGMAPARPTRGSHPPGTFWYYNNWDFNALGTIYEQATKTGIYDALAQEIASPIGMQDYRPQDGEYFTGRESIHRAYPLRMSARDLARFALLYLHNGNWAGRQLVSATSGGRRPPRQCRKACRRVRFSRWAPAVSTPLSCRRPISSWWVASTAIRSYRSRILATSSICFG